MGNITRGDRRKEEEEIDIVHRNRVSQRESMEIS